MSTMVLRRAVELLGLSICVSVAASCLAACGTQFASLATPPHGGRSSGGPPVRNPGDSVSVVRRTSDMSGAANYVVAPNDPISVKWGGQPAPGQPSSAMIRDPYILTPSDQVIATAYVRNTTEQTLPSGEEVVVQDPAASQTYTVDVFVATSVPSQQIGLTADNWPGVVWDWAASNGGDGQEVTVAPGQEVQVVFDWGARNSSGTPLSPGSYFAVVSLTSATSPSSPEDAFWPIDLASN